MAGGDINQAFALDTNQGTFFLKANQNTWAAQLFEAETKGLQLLAQASLRVPELIESGTIEHTAFLLMRYVPSGIAKSTSWEQLGQGLALLHQHPQDQFGLDHHNFIGSLPQSNGYHSSWPDFYRAERLAPQAIAASQRGLLSDSLLAALDRLYVRLPELCPEEPASLIHGDLWSGNFLFDQDGQPCWIDPSVCYAHREMDLAMTRLFGGFAPEFYRAYEAVYPLAPGFEQRLEIYQLYYLLVHVNLFGASYVGSVRRILERF